MTELLTAGEAHMCNELREKDRRLRAFLNERTLPEGFDAASWLAYLNGIKTVLGNINNNLAFVATLLIKQYLERRFSIVDFDAAGKLQGAAGLDIFTRTRDGRTIVGELKTTKPYQPGFGAKQRETVLKDLVRLAASDADHRFMFVIDSDAYSTLCKPTFAKHAGGIEIVNIVTGQGFMFPQTA